MGLVCELFTWTSSPHQYQVSGVHVNVHGKERHRDILGSRFKLAGEEPQFFLKVKSKFVPPSR